MIIYTIYDYIYIYIYAEVTLYNVFMNEKNVTHTDYY